MGANNVLVRREGGTVIATINRPDKLNALNKDVFDELKALLDVLDTEKQAKALIIAGAGEKAFCVGADLKERQGMNEKAVLMRFAQVKALYAKMEDFRLPIIAAVDGLALGGGLELALACDMRVAASTASLGFPEVGLAIIPGNGGTQRLSRLVGMGRALELILTGRRLSASEAETLGLVNQVVPPGEAVQAAKRLAEQMRISGPLALAQAKRAIRQGFEVPLKEALDIETEAYRVCLQSQDRLEGLNAFTEKRTPEYRGE